MQYIKRQEEKYGKSKNRGNALFLILIAVALFAALAYAVTQSSRGSSGGVGREQADILGAQIVQIAAQTEQTIQRMALLGTPLSSIRAGNGAYYEPGCGTANGCDDFCTSGTTCIFAPDGGGAPLPQIPRAAIVFPIPNPVSVWFPVSFAGPTGFNGSTIIGFNGSPSDATVNGAGTSAVDEVMTIYPLKREVCESINRHLGISGIIAHDGSHDFDFGGPNFLSGCVDFYNDGRFYDYIHTLNAN